MCTPRHQILLVNYFIFIVKFGHWSFQFATEDITIQLSIHIFIKNSSFSWSMGRNASPYAQLSSPTSIYLFNRIQMKPLFVCSPYFHLILFLKHIKRRLIRENYILPIVHTEINMLLTPGHSFVVHDVLHWATVSSCIRNSISSDNWRLFVKW